METITSQLLYLLKCAVSNQSPDLSKISDMKKVLKFAEIQSLIPYIYNTLKKAGDKEIDAYSGYINQKIAQAAMQDYYREQVSEKLSSLSVPHVFLKGKDVLKFLPSNIMRFSCDVDVYYPEEYRKIVNEAMILLGFSKEITEEINDFYYIPPCVSIETHFKSDNYQEKIYDDFSRFIKKDKSLYQMKDEDIYVYYLIHAAKHFRVSGIGLRALIDIYFIKKGVDSGSEYVKEVLKEACLTDFEYHISKLASLLFEGGELDGFYKSLLIFIVRSATYGSDYNKTLLQTQEDKTPETAGKRQLKRRIFPPYRDMIKAYPSLSKVPFLLPFYWAWRLIYALLFKRARVKSEYKTIKNLETNEILKNKEMFDKLNLK